MTVLKRLGELASALLVAALALLVAANLYLMAAPVLTDDDHPTVFGYSRAIVLSGSMAPAIEIDDLVIAKAQDSYEVGDIITFDNGHGLTTHRIHGVAEEGFVTKGDANNTPDVRSVNEDAIIGKVVYSVPNIGLWLYALGSPLGMMVLVLLILLVIEVPYVYRQVKEEKPERKCSP